LEFDISFLLEVYFWFAGGGCGHQDRTCQRTFNWFTVTADTAPRPLRSFFPAAES
jgi:hypothetical protein